MCFFFQTHAFCSTTCGDHQFCNATDSCDDCDPSCATCSESSSNCTSCSIENSKFLYIDVAARTQECVSNCTTTTFKNYDNATCDMCGEKLRYCANDQCSTQTAANPHALDTRCSDLCGQETPIYSLDLRHRTTCTRMQCSNTSLLLETCQCCVHECPAKYKPDGDRAKCIPVPPSDGDDSRNVLVLMVGIILAAVLLVIVVVGVVIAMCRKRRRSNAAKMATLPSREDLEVRPIEVRFAAVVMTKRDVSVCNEAFNK